MSSVTVDCLSLPEPGRYIHPNEGRGFLPSTNIQLSLQQVLRNRDAALNNDSNSSSEQQQQQQQHQLLGVGRPLRFECLSPELKEKVKAGKDIIWTTDLDVELPIKMAESGPAAIPPQTLVEFFADCVRRFGSEPALLFEPHFDNSSNSSSSSSGSGSGSGSAEEADDGGTQYVEYFTKDTLENAKKMIAVRERQLQQQQQQQQQQPPLLPGGSRVLQQIVVYRDRVPSAWKDLYKGVVIDYHTFIGMGEKVKERDLSNAIERQKPGCCCCIVYTSGTTGKPKGVMLSHDNITWTASLMAQIVSLSNKDRIISFLPLSHIAAQVVDLVAPLIMGSTVYFARPDALRGTLLYTLLRVKPTWFLGVPRVWEKIEQRLKEVGSRSSSIRRHLAAAAKDIGFKGATALLKGEKPSLLFHPVNKLLLQQVRKAIGFDCCTAWGSCAAPIDPETQKYFLSLGMPINSLYGLSESTGPQTFVAPSPGW
ncbi:very long-chain acyl-CoA synthetase, putative [Eimeria acervulina]|uniref:Very long-chain acyl-CoA synthetase, putative n=1 Tax=Eimeria acervulina TaxID=5801 RepID=U6GKQ8_EIMAC|nr:very long-chain acyl-CoA synthetase, putative [Eimeria acervulina]CDI80755.1 very long-chain acyl-CoA synthetase, putative [Eimeria acervulina]